MLTDLNLQPKNGTYLQHALAAFSGRPLWEIVANPHLLDGEMASLFSVSFINEKVPLAEAASQMLRKRNISPEEQPEMLIEGASRDEGGYFCPDVYTSRFLQMLIGVYGLATPGDYSLSWTDLRFPADLLERHYLLVDAELVRQGM